MELTDLIPREPITLNGTPCFCDEGSSLALDYLQTARNALKKSAAMRNESGIKGAVVESLEEFLRHSRSCETCK